jgi:hypothetical protein
VLSSQIPEALAEFLTNPPLLLGVCPPENQTSVFWNIKTQESYYIDPQGLVLVAEGIAGLDLHLKFWEEDRDRKRQSLGIHP